LTQACTCKVQPHKIVHHARPRPQRRLQRRVGLARRETAKHSVASLATLDVSSCPPSPSPQALACLALTSSYSSSRYFCVDSFLLSCMGMETASAASGSVSWSWNWVQ